MDTYHLHLAFDISSFVGVSNTAALVCWRYCRAKIGDGNERVTWFHGRYRAAFIFVFLYLILTILLCVRLEEWAPKTSPGRCYYSNLVTSPGASHPGDDQIYVSVTASWLIVVVLASVFCGVGKRRTILVLCSLHFPLHLYMTIALRLANHGRFEGEVKHENEWDFGQTTAVILLAIAIRELIGKGKEYYDFERRAAKHGMSRRGSRESADQDQEANHGTEGYLLQKSINGSEEAPRSIHPALDGHSRF
ncbi:uncharacterized protein N7469_009703 [Penicillium citrinum]|uniref:Uncharacterized protein n=1 Tax=Penicillium citrinum TaxID=5077 RepID=A0A9W9NIV9_PENCI|nr:uncharacterized protein N7469_009703 [Penicillium citrinum]KAJ5220816.1 hypothetical protein N7469_009703 [Penicillium citrinum]